MPNLPKPKKKKRTCKTASEKRHMDAVAELGCIACQMNQRGFVAASFHHCLTGMGRKKIHFKGIALCAKHHQYPEFGFTAFHADKRKFSAAYGTQEELLLKTYAKLDAMGKLEPGAMKIYEEMK